MKNFDFVMTGLQSWDIPIGSNAIDIARQISRNNRVLYVNSAMDVTTLMRSWKGGSNDRRLSVVRRKQSPLRQVDERLWVLDQPFVAMSVNGLPDGALFDTFNRLNNRMFFSSIRRTVKQLGFDKFVHLIDNDIYRSFFGKEYLDAVLSVYYRRDNLPPFPYWRKHATRLEPQLISKSDIVLCNSPELAEHAAKFNPRSYSIGQGVDVEAYDVTLNMQEPEELSRIPHPRVGYVGDINSLRLDADLIHEVAIARPDWSVVLIGPEDKVFAEHALHGLPNVHFVGRVAKSRVPAFMHALDVCMNPQQVNEITLGNYPRKVDEYLAMGKPVVATRTRTMEIFRDHTYLCTGAGEYVGAIENALADNTGPVVAERIRFARSHSWENNVKEIYKHIENTLK